MKFLESSSLPKPKKLKPMLFILTGLSLGIIATLLTFYGNPGNMGVCAACFLRDSAGALGLHRAEIVQYLRPEILGLIIGGFVSSLFWGRDFKSQSNSSAFVMFFLGAFGMIGALVFLGCPWRAFLRLGGGDLSAIAGILGLVAGIFGGILFKKHGYTLSEEVENKKAFGYIPVIIAILLLAALLLGLNLGDNAPLFSSTKGPGSLHAPIILSLLGGLVIGAFMQKSKFCSIGAISRAIRGEFSMFYGILALVASVVILNLILGQFNLGFVNQPIAHNDYIWNFIAMALCGLCFSLSSGCPGKHLVQMGSGNLGSGVFILGMLVGAAFSHNFILASSPKGITEFAQYALAIGFAFVVFVGFSGRNKAIA